ncbi:MAG: trypsin-like peptidase domain-containing protein [Verrucomicrobia bacterium]|nr:trypsin-like peptidase domain-containing protein [Verrucomicrobiota bacterium]
MKTNILNRYHAWSLILRPVVTATVAIHALWAPLTTFALFERTPEIVPATRIDDPPYCYTGLIIMRNADGGRWGGSGAVVRFPRVVLTAAHVVHDATDGAYDWFDDIRWYWRWNQGHVPEREEGQLLRGFYTFSQYVDLARIHGQNSDQAFSEDFAAAYAYEDLAGGRSAPAYDDGLAALGSTRAKLIIGYPFGLYDKSDPTRLLMRETGPVTTKAETREGNFLELADTAIGGGNSGGPVWVKDGDMDRWAGVVVARIDVFFGIWVSTGIWGMDQDGWELAERAFADSDPSGRLRPGLSIAAVRGGMVITARESGQFQLQQKADLSDPVWTNAGDPFATSIEIPVNEPAGFFRLQRL